MLEADDFGRGPGFSTRDAGLLRPAFQELVADVNAEHGQRASNLVPQRAGGLALLALRPLSASVRQLAAGQTAGIYFGYGQAWLRHYVVDVGGEAPSTRASLEQPRGQARRDSPMPSEQNSIDAWTSSKLRARSAFPGTRSLAEYVVGVGEGSRRPAGRCGRYRGRLSMVRVAAAWFGRRLEVDAGSPSRTSRIVPATLGAP